MDNLLENDLMRLLPLLLEMVGLTFAVLIDPYLNKRYERGMIVIILLIISLVMQNFAEYILSDHIVMPELRTGVSFYGYCVRPVILALFFYIVETPKRVRILWGMVILNGLIHSTAFYTDICFTITSGNHYMRGTLGYTCHIISGILLLQLLFVSIWKMKSDRKIENVIPFINVIVIVISVVMDSVIPPGNSSTTYLTIAIVCCTVFYYIWLHLMFERQHEKSIQADQRIKIMMSQIQPHFLYNTLSTIQALCKTDPDKAFDTTEKFGTYLRQNIDSLSKSDLIPIDKEIEHTRIYSEIETTRFPNVHIDFDIEDSAFDLPALTVQPLVENSIRHGVRIRRDGQVNISTRNTGEFHEILITDNGKGFDVSTLENMSGTHIGIANVRERIREMCGGEMIIVSNEGEGTTITIRLPVVDAE